MFCSLITISRCFINLVTCLGVRLRALSILAGYIYTCLGVRLRALSILAGYRISPSISREIYPRTKYYTDNSSYTRVTPSGKK